MKTRLFAMVLVALALAFGVAALSSGPATASGSTRCPIGHSQMGCSLPPVLKGVSTPPRGEIFPDVSSYQGAVDWRAVKLWQTSHGWKVTGGIFKLGENVIDPYAIQNARGLRAAGMVAIGYVFVRPGLEASRIIGWTRETAIKVVVLDEEVPGIQGTAGRVVPALKAAGLTPVVDYHSAQENFDRTAQGLDCWVADYGPSTPPACATGPRVAWQFTSLGSVPGISGIVDESVSYGLLKRAAPRKPQRTICFGPHAHGSATCARVIGRYAFLTAKRDYWHRAFRHCERHASSLSCAYPWHQYWLRGRQAAKLRKRYSA